MPVPDCIGSSIPRKGTVVGAAIDAVGITATSEPSSLRELVVAIR
jgi:hypothetical protein